MNMPIKPIIKGILSYTPVKSLIMRKGTGGTNSARYCYSVWLRHLVLLYQNGMKMHPKIVAELGPGDSIGIGLAALITGAEKYYAFDVIKHTDLKDNIIILDELIDLFNNRASIPREDEFPELKPSLDSYSFPEHLFNDFYLDKTKIKKIKSDLMMGGGDTIKYIVPWNGVEKIEENSVDLVFSQAVMEHVIDLENAYRIMFKWLKNEGYISHQIDYKAHETHKVWNGHWKYNDLVWKIIMHGRSYPINRAPHSEHIKLIKKTGFKVKKIIEVKRYDGYEKNKLPLKYTTNLLNEDLIIESAHIIAKK